MNMIGLANPSYSSMAMFNSGDVHPAWLSVFALIQ